MITFNHVINNGSTQPVFPSVGFHNILSSVELTGGKPQILGLIVPNLFNQELHLAMHDPVLLDSFNFKLFFAVNFEG